MTLTLDPSNVATSFSYVVLAQDSLATVAQAGYG